MLYVLRACRQAKARAAREAAALATQEAAGRLLVHLDELHERLGQLRVQVCNVIDNGRHVVPLAAFPTRAARHLFRQHHICSCVLVWHARHGSSSCLTPQGDVTPVV
jgi:hypothetical protein